jgi:3-oxoacyl-[acyl-carrier protein] reductase
VLVNNAGIYGPMGPSETVDWDHWVQAMEINVFGSVLMCRALLPHFRRRRYGKIIQLSGGGATNPLPRLSAYAASKAAIRALRRIARARGEGRGDRRQLDRAGARIRA